MRKALHIHMLIQLHGFSHPKDLFGSHFVDMFRKVWYFVASISFRSSEGFAAYTGERAALEALRNAPIVPITPKQRGLLGEERTRQASEAQLHARGLTEQRAPKAQRPAVKFQVPDIFKSASASSAEWSEEAMTNIHAKVLKTGNHICRADVCYKGRIGKHGFCRMLFWHWVQYTTKKGERGARRQH